MRSRLLLVLGGNLLFALGACGPAGPSKTAFSYRADLLPAVYFPLAAGTVWSYRATNPTGEGGELLIVTKVLSRDGTTATISTAPNPLSYEDRGDQIVRLPSGTPILKTPLRVDATWAIPDGTARITSVGAVVEAPAGRYPNCIVVEETTTERRLITSYAPGVGPVKVEIFSRGSSSVPGGEQLVSRALLGSFSTGGEQQ